MEHVPPCHRKATGVLAAGSGQHGGRTDPGGGNRPFPPAPYGIAWPAVACRQRRRRSSDRQRFLGTGRIRRARTPAGACRPAPPIQCYRDTRILHHAQAAQLHEEVADHQHLPRELLAPWLVPSNRPSCFEDHLHEAASDRHSGSAGAGTGGVTASCPSRLTTSVICLMPVLSVAR